MLRVSAEVTTLTTARPRPLESLIGLGQVAVSAIPAAKIKCISCGYEFTAGEWMKANYKKGNLLKAMRGAPRAIFCPRCDIEGPDKFVCSECGQYHAVTSGPCPRVNR